MMHLYFKQYGRLKNVENVVMIFGGLYFSIKGQMFAFLVCDLWQQ